MKKLLPKSLRNPSGFTLVELLVVISIIAILSVIGITVYSGVQKGARDTRRKGDIDAIASALEVNKTTNAYVALDGTKFASGTVPIDSGNGAATYCVLSNTTATPPAVIAAAWTVATCPSSYSSVIATSVPIVASATSWTVCASLEVTGATPYCKSSSQ